ncbi:Endoglucanase 19 [Hibiscus syriacus]|uniref:cellulase n=1 Tax=Hibiscus syriacus TaxID=106335 RepID=A0A6A2ZCL3_HIBSY|nr:Endoglucanase 19 [Hibiscus syriacus]
MGSVVAWLPLLLVYIVAVKGHDFDYREALSKSLIFLEAQRSGKLPPNNRLAWRGDSGLDDGKDANEDLVGGYYDAGDNVKYGLPMAFTITTLAWSAIAFKSELKSAGELENVRAAIRWGTDYFLKAAAKHDRLYVHVGDPEKDHQYWVTPEDMKGPMPVLQINSDNPGTEIAGETSAAMAAASMVFRRIDAPYARHLLSKAKLLREEQYHQVHSGFGCTEFGATMLTSGDGPPTAAIIHIGANSFLGQWLIPRHG